MRNVRKNFIKNTWFHSLRSPAKSKKKHWCGLCTFLGWISASNTIGGMWISKFAIGGSLDDKGTKNLGIWLSSYLARFQSKPWRPRRRSTLLYTTTRLRGANIQVYMGMTNRPAIWLAQILAHVEINFPCEWIADDDQKFRPVITWPAWYCHSALWPDHKLSLWRFFREKTGSGKSGKNPDIKFREFLDRYCYLPIPHDDIWITANFFL